MKLRTALLAGIGLIGGACLLPLAPASAQTSATTGAAGAANPSAPGANNSGVIHTPSTSTTPASGNMGAAGSTMGSTTGSTAAPGSSTMGSASGTSGSYGTSGSATMGSNSNMGSDNVSKLQQALNDNGESVKVDGVMGPSTEKALRSYQQKNGLQASGQLDDQTRQKLNLGG